MICNQNITANESSVPPQNTADANGNRNAVGGTRMNIDRSFGLCLKGMASRVAMLDSCSPSDPEAADFCSTSVSVGGRDVSCTRELELLSTVHVATSDTQRKRTTISFRQQKVFPGGNFKSNGSSLFLGQTACVSCVKYYASFARTYSSNSSPSPSCCLLVLFVGIDRCPVLIVYLF